MTTADDVIRRMADDAVFARLVEDDPDSALAGFGLRADELARIGRVIAAVHPNRRPSAAPQPSEEHP